MFAQFRHNLDLSQSPHRVNLIDEGIVDFLDGYAVTVKLINGLPDCAIVASAHLLYKFVLCLYALINSILVMHIFLLGKLALQLLGLLIFTACGIIS